MSNQYSIGELEALVREFLRNKNLKWTNDVIKNITHDVYSNYQQSGYNINSIGPQLESTVNWYSQNYEIYFSKKLVGKRLKKKQE